MGKIEDALQNDPVLKEKVVNSVKESLEKELVAANVIKPGELETQNVGCVSVLLSTVCTC